MSIPANSPGNGKPGSGNRELDYGEQASRLSETRHNDISFSSWGKQRRIHRLATTAGTYLWLAADHGLTFGPMPGLTDLGAVISLAGESGFSGVVLNRGAVRFLPPKSRLGLVLQSFGLPDDASERKVMLFPPNAATKISAEAVALELNLSRREIGAALQEVSSSITLCDEQGIPTLLMMNPANEKPGPAALAQAIRTGTELGVDFIKVPIIKEVLNADKASLTTIQGSVSSAPPVLLAGGPSGENFLPTVKLSKRLGFSGVCTGRNLFEAPDMARAIDTVCTIYS